MHWLDWVLMMIPILIVIAVGLYAQKYVKGVSDFLAAGQVAGRYVIAVAGGEAAMGLISVVSAVERTYASGFGLAFWNNLTTPLTLLFALTGYCVYRYRQTKALTLGQFLEIRYNRSFRIYASILQAFSGILNYAIFPAVGARFMIYFLDLPIYVGIAGWNFPTFGLLMAGFLTIAVFIACLGGQITIMVTDCIQGILSYPMYIIVVLAIFLKISYFGDMEPILMDQPEGKSFLNPYDIEKLRTFNLFFVIAGIIGSIINRMSWNSAQGYNAAALNAHEQKMGGLLGTWRSGFSLMMVLVIAAATYTYMKDTRFFEEKHGTNTVNRQLALKALADVLSAPEYDGKREISIDKVEKSLPRYDEAAQKELASVEKGSKTVDNYHRIAVNEITQIDKSRVKTFKTIHNQMRATLTMREMLPIGVTGIFCAIMFFLMLSTDTTYMHSWGGTLVQDVILPIYNKTVTPKQHLRLLRCGIIFVALTAFIFSFYFSQMDYILMFFAITGAIWLGGAGSCIVFGLYWKRGTTAGAFTSLTTGAVLAVGGMICQQTWVQYIYPWFEEIGAVGTMDKILKTLSSPLYPYIDWYMSPNEFPLNSQEIYFFAMMAAIIMYVLVSLATCRKPFNMDKMLHRGIYSENGIEKAPEKMTWKKFLLIFTGVTPEYKKGDKILAWSVFIWSFGVYFVLLFIMPIIWNIFYEWPLKWWSVYFWFRNIFLAAIVGLVSTVWFTWGGTIDLIKLFKRLKEREAIDENNNGLYVEKNKE